MRTALIIPTGLDEGLRSALLEACSASDLRASFADVDAEADSAHADVIVALLESGQRSLPPAVHGTAESGRPTLLLSRDPLVDGARALSSGALTLLGAPHSARRIAGRLRALTARNEVQKPATRMHAREWRTPTSWSAGVALLGTSLSLEHEVVGCESRWFLRSHEERKPLLTLDTTTFVARAEVPLGARAWLLSPRRLPPFWELGQKAVRHPAAGGDVYLFTCSLAGQSMDFDALACAAECGADGPALFERLEERLDSSQASSPGAALVVELFE